MPVKYKLLGMGNVNDYLWERSLDLIQFPGCYAVEIEHTDSDVGLPFDFCGQKHYIVGTLIVTDNGTKGKVQKNRLTGQALVVTLQNSIETKIFIRTYVCGEWSVWRALVMAGMYDNITTTDELLATVESLVDENIRTKQVEEEIKRSVIDINSVLGHDAGTIVLKASDLLPITWSNNLGVVNSTAYNTWVLPLYEGREYTAPAKTFVTKRTCSVYPVVGENPEMTLIPSSAFTATADMKYLVITVTMSAYDGSDYSIEASESGLSGEINTIKRTLTTEKERVDVITNNVGTLKEDVYNLNSSVGNKEAQSLFLTENNFSGLKYNGNGVFLKADDIYNSIIVPISEDSSISFEATKGRHGSVYTFSDMPKVGDMAHVRKLLTSDFVVEPNERFVLFNITLDEFVGGEISYSASAGGLHKKVNDIGDRVELLDSDLNLLNNVVAPLDKKVNELDVEQRKLTNVLGVTEQTIELTAEQFDNIIWNGTAFKPSNATYNGFVIRIIPGQRVIYSAAEANNVRTLTDYPSIDSTDYVRTREELKGNFIAQDNENYLFLNTMVETHSSYIVTLGGVGVVEQIDKFNKFSLPLKGKTIVCFGDSITEFNDSYGKGYTDYLAEFSGANIVRAGVGGAAFAIRKEIVEVPEKAADCYAALDIPNLVKSWATKDWVAVDNAIAWLAQNYNDDNSKQIQALKDNPIENADIVVVFGGSNDLNMPSFGTPSDTNPLINTCGGIYQIIDSILSVKPDMPIYFYNPLPRMCDGDIWCDDYRKEETDAYGSTSFASLTKRIKECVEYHHIPCCDMYHTIGINRKNIYTYARDGVHVTGAFKKIANRIYGFIMENRIWQ